MSDVPAFVYALAEPTTGVVRYVGRSINPVNRLSTHMSRSAAPAVRSWVNSLNGEQPRLVILHKIGDGDDADGTERHYIEHFRAHGDLLNDLRSYGAREPAFDSAGRRSLLKFCRTRGSQRSIAAAVGVPHPTISQWASGRRVPNAPMREKLRVALGIEWNEWDEKPPSEAAE